MDLFLTVTATTVMTWTGNTIPLPLPAASRFPGGRFLAQIAPDKPVGVEVTGKLPSPDAFANQSGWAWFLATPAAEQATPADTLRKLYSDPQIVALPAAP